MIPLPVSDPNQEGKNICLSFVILLDNIEDSIIVWNFVVYCMWMPTSLFQSVEVLLEVALSKYVIY